MEPRQSGLQTRRSYSFASSPVCKAWNVLRLKNSVPASCTTHAHRSRPPPLCNVWSSAADVKKSEPAKKTAASTSEPTSSTKPGSGPTRKQAEPMANSAPIHRVAASVAAVAPAVPGAALMPTWWVASSARGVVNARQSSCCSLPRATRAEDGSSHERRHRGAVCAAKGDPMVAVDEKSDVEAATAPAVPHFTPSERAARGRSTRAECPRSSHADFEIADDRDPVEILEAQATSRVPELVPVRYGRMLVSPFTFYRGAAAVMAHDLASTPRAGLRAQLCGDAHLSNFGLFAAPDRRLVFDLNDFDETLPGPWEWDVKRLAVSFEVAGRENGYTQKQRRGIVRATVAAYRQAMRKFAGMRALEVWYSRVEVDELMAQLRGQLKKGMTKRVDETVAKARTRDSMKAFAK